MCGEKLNRKTSCLHYLGSPPRVRGKVFEYQNNKVRTGITPACAGKRVWHSSFSPSWWDHPRVCGEKCPIAYVYGDAVGSPPRVRGKEARQTGDVLSPGITPACAGKRFSVLVRVHSRRDHPRVCGEKGLTFHQMLRPTGSPPRVRGKGRHRCACPVQSRITPACAGKSQRIHFK